MAIAEEQVLTEQQAVENAMKVDIVFEKEDDEDDDIAEQNDKQDNKQDKEAESKQEGEKKEDKGESVDKLQGSDDDKKPEPQGEKKEDTRRTESWAAMAKKDYELRQREKKVESTLSDLQAKEGHYKELDDFVKLFNEDPASVIEENWPWIFDVMTERRLGKAGDNKEISSLRKEISELKQALQGKPEQKKEEKKPDAQQEDVNVYIEEYKKSIVAEASKPEYKLINLKGAQEIVANEVLRMCEASDTIFDDNKIKELVKEAEAFFAKDLEIMKRALGLGEGPKKEENKSLSNADGAQRDVADKYSRVDEDERIRRAIEKIKFEEEDK